jgi:hypothetical protein
MKRGLIQRENSFTSCYDHNSTQEEIFNKDVEPLVDVVYSGVVSFSMPTTSREKILTILDEDRNNLRLRRYLIWQDTHNAGNEGRARNHPSYRPGLISASLPILDYILIDTYTRRSSIDDLNTNNTSSHTTCHTWSSIKMNLMTFSLNARPYATLPTKMSFVHLLTWFILHRHLNYLYVKTATAWCLSRTSHRYPSNL